METYNLYTLRSKIIVDANSITEALQIVNQFESVQKIVAVIREDIDESGETFEKYRTK